VLQGVAQIAALALVWVGFARGPASTERLLRYGAAALVAFVALSKVLSPQYLVWLVLLVPLVVGVRGRGAMWLTVLACALTAAWFPAGYWDLVREFDPLSSWLVLFRGVALVALLAVLTATEREPARSRSPVPSPGRT
jgi:hypothetical protein